MLFAAVPETTDIVVYVLIGFAALLGGFWGF